jgi:hypothetical protein
MTDPTDPSALARAIGSRYGVTPVTGYRIDAEELELPIVGRELSMVGVAKSNYYLRLHFWGRPDFVLEVEGSGAVKPPSAAEPIAVAPQAGPYAEMTALVGARVATATASHDGALRIGFDDGTMFSVDEPRSYETWQLRDEENVYTLVTHAGGGLVQFATPEASLPRWTPVPPSRLQRAKALSKRMVGR